MRLLVWPLITSPRNVGSDSGYTYVRNVLRRVDFGHWYVVLPDWGDDHGLVEDDLDDNPRVTKIYVPSPYGYREQESAADPSVIWKFGPQQGEIPVEGVLSMSPMRTLSLANAWMIRMGSTFRPLLVNYDLMARDDTGDGGIPNDDIELMHAAAGTWAADLNIFQSPLAARRARSNVAKWLSPAASRKVTNQSETIMSGVDLDRMDSAGAGVEKRSRFSIYYGGRINPGKGTTKLGEVVDTCYRYGRDMDFVVCTGSLGGWKELELRKMFPEVELHKSMSQEGAWRIQAGCHAAICFSRTEMVGLGFWEAMAAGLPVLMKRGEWNEELLPADYPWFFDNHLEAVALMREMYNEWKDGKFNPDPRWRDFAREHFDSDQNQGQMISVIEGAMEAKREECFARYNRGTRSTVIEMVAEVLEDGMGWTELIEKIKGTAERRWIIGKRLDWARSHAYLEVYRAALYSGWTDDVLQPMPVFMKP